MLQVIVIFFVTFFTLSTGFSLLSNSIRHHRLFASVEVGSASEIPQGERKIIDTDQGSIIVGNVGGSFYAVNAKCPHLGLPMKKGAIEVIDGTPQITCNFHNSKFSLQDGSCSQWCTGVLGLPGTGFLASVSGKFGGAENSPATTYPVTVSEDGKLSIEF